MTHDPSAHVVIDPARNGGRPSLPGGPATEFVAGAVWAGDPVEDVADNYGLTVPAVLVACWYEYRQPMRRGWPEGGRHAWAELAEAHLWDGTYDPIPDPPTRGGDTP